MTTLWLYYDGDTDLDTTLCDDCGPASKALSGGRIAPVFGSVEDVEPDMDRECAHCAATGPIKRPA